MANERRRQRLQSLMVEVISELLQRQVKDPRLGFASVTRVELSSDLRHARVYVSVMGSDEEMQETMQLLERAKGFLRSELAHRIRIRFVPDITFRLDRGIERGARVLQLLRELEIPPAEGESAAGAAGTDGAGEARSGSSAEPTANTNRPPTPA